MPPAAAANVPLMQRQLQFVALERPSKSKHKPPDESSTLTPQIALLALLAQTSPVF
jgi:hypothetical protein